jgi:altronate dehydratase large subunit
MNFLGYIREDGSIGVRNYVAVMPTVNCVNSIAVSIANKVQGAIPLPHIGRCAYLGKDQERLLSTLIGLGKNPNIGGVLIVGLGCEASTADQIAEKIITTGKRTEVLTVDKMGSVDAVIDRGIELVKEMTKYVSKIKRAKVKLGNLTLAIKCGGSDSTSGISGNIITGLIADRIIEEGGTVIFTETAELLGAEHILAKRAKDKEVANKIYKIVDNKEKNLMLMGVDIRSCEPTPANIQGGLTTIEEKSLGAIAKSGTHSIQDVLEWGESPKAKGLFLMDGPSHTAEIFSGVASAGAQILIFSIGGGLPAKLPIVPAHSGRFPIMPIVKLTGNPQGYKNIKNFIDIYVGSIIEGKETINKVADRAYIEFIKIVSGEIHTVSETYTDYIEPMNLYFTGPLV